MRNKIASHAGRPKTQEKVLSGSSTAEPNSRTRRIDSIDALRGFVMFMMIFVNDLAGAGKVVPDWMVHFSDRHRGGSGMTFVDLVFPAFLFIVGMSIPFALGGRLSKGQSPWKVLAHVAVRTLALLLIGILMVHETPDTTALGWPGDWWCVLMYSSAIAAFCSFAAPSSSSQNKQRTWGKVNWGVRLAGLAALIWLAFVFRGANGQRIVTLAPPKLNTEWYGILGLIGWAYLVTSIVFLAFGRNRTAILGCMALLMCLFAADRRGLFEGFWLNSIVGIGGTLGSLPAISVGGLVLGSMLTAEDMNSLKMRSIFTFWFIAACAAAAFLLTPVYGISKNSATPAWCFWSCVVTTSVWYGFHLLSDQGRPNLISRIFQLAGQNVLLAYLISEMLPSLLDVLGLSEGYGRLGGNLAGAITRSILCATVVLVMSTSLNRIGFRLKL